MLLLKDIFLHKLIPMISYFELEEFLTTLCFKEDEIASIKKKEYHIRLVYEENPQLSIIRSLKLYTLDSSIQS